VIRVPPIGRLEKIKMIASLGASRSTDIIYGHFPASRYNIKQLRQRYQIRACVIPLRPIGATLCSLINYTRAHKGPLDPKILGLTEAFGSFHKLSDSEAFFLLALRYLGPIQTIIEGWIYTCASEGIQIAAYPFESTTTRQQELVESLRTMAVTAPETDREGPPPKEIRENLSKGTKAHLNEIDGATLKAVLQMATAIFSSNTDLQSLHTIRDYLLSDLSQNSPRQSHDAPLAWTLP
jgi:hypothetical protein